MIETIADRLRTALERSPFRGVQEFQRELGTPSYSTVARYFSGDIAEPPLSFLASAGDLLGVDAGSLAFGGRAGLITTAAPTSPNRPDGTPMFDAEDFTVARVLGPGGTGTRTSDVIRDGLCAGAGSDVGPKCLWGLEAVFWRRWSAQEEHFDKEDRLSVWDLAEAVGRAAVAPLRAFGIDPAGRERWEVESFLAAMYGPLMDLARSFDVQSEA